MLRRQLTFITLVAHSVGAFAADEWPQFRGPQGDGHSTATNLPVEWDVKTGKNIAWKAALPGEGHSSPVISGDQIWVTTAVIKPFTEAEKKKRLDEVPNSRGLDLADQVILRAVCVDRESGEISKNIKLFTIETPEPVHALNSYASPTPVIEKGRLYCHFGTYGTACVETKTGDILWSNRKLKIDHQNGPGASPILWKDLLIAQYDGIDRQFVAALNKRTGDVAWNVKRSGELPQRREFQKAYATPHIVVTGGHPVLISPGSDWVYGYNPANGEELWRIRYGQLGFSTVPRPVIGHGMAFVVTSFMKSRLLAVRYDGEGDVSSSHVVWKSDRQIPQKPSVLLVGDHLYLVNDAGIATALDAKTGKEVWRERLNGKFAASPLYADGRIYACGQEGKVTVFAPDDKFKSLAVNEMPDGIMASPAAVGSELYIRTESQLVRIEKPSNP